MKNLSSIFCLPSLLHSHLPASEVSFSWLQKPSISEWHCYSDLFSGGNLAQPRGVRIKQLVAAVGSRGQAWDEVNKVTQGENCPIRKGCSREAARLQLLLPPSVPVRHRSWAVTRGFPALAHRSSTGCREERARSLAPAPSPAGKSQLQPLTRSCSGTTAAPGGTRSMQAEFSDIQHSATPF